ncbi:MAG: DUF1819 family protein [Eubacterium sp.]
MGVTKSGSLYKGTARITREPFLFYEMRITAKLICKGLSDKEIVDQIADENLFQYPTEKHIRQIARDCLKRLRAMEDDTLIHAVAEKSSDTARQVCVYALMRRNRLFWEFMITVIAEKFRQQDFSFSPREVSSFLLRLQEQDDGVAEWSESTIQKIRQVLIRILVEAGYLEKRTSDHLNRVLIDPLLERTLRDKGDSAALAAFNCF